MEGMGLISDRNKQKARRRGQLSTSREEEKEPKDSGDGAVSFRKRNESQRRGREGQHHIETRYTRENRCAGIVKGA